MAEILRGSRTGRQVKLIDCYDNYAEFTDGTRVNVGSVLFTGDEMRRIKRAGKRTGNLFIEYDTCYDPVLDGYLFKRKRRHYAYN